MIGRETVPALARLLVRQGSADAGEWLALAARHAARADVLEWLVPAGLAHIEHAWLSGDHGRAGPYPDLLLERTDRPGTGSSAASCWCTWAGSAIRPGPFRAVLSRTPRR